MTSDQAATIRREKLEEMAHEFQRRADTRVGILARLNYRPGHANLSDLEMAAERDGWEVAAKAVRLLAAGVLTP